MTNSFRKMRFFLFAILLVGVLFVYYFFVTRFTMDLFKLEMLGYVFDSLARNLLLGNSTVDFSSIEWEAYFINNKFYTYWGPFPAFIRMIPLILSHPMYGMLTRFSCFLSAILSLIYFTLSINLVTGKLSVLLRSVMRVLLILGFSFASPLFFLIQNPDSYNEVISWGLAFSVMSLYHILAILNNKPFSVNMIFLSLYAGLSLLVKPTFTLSLMLVFFLFLLFKAFNICSFNEGKISLKKYLVVLLPLFLCSAIQLTYNYSRTGDFYFFFDTSKQYQNLNKQALCKSTKGFDTRRIGISLENYFLLDNKAVNNQFPYVSFYLPEHHPLYDHMEVMFPFSFAYSWLVAGFFFFIGVVMSLRERSLPILISVIFFLQIILISSYEAITYRYTAEFLPFFLFVNLFALSKICIGNPLLKYRYFFMIYTLYIFINIPISVISSLTFYEAELNVYKSFTTKSDKEARKTLSYVISPEQFFEKSTERTKIINLCTVIRNKLNKSI